MNRNITSEAIILRTRRIGDYHKGVSCITPDMGLVDAVVYGGYKGKSKLSGATDPFSLLHIHFYYNPVKKSYKVEDVEERRTYTGIRGDLERFFRASLLSEIVLKSYAGGGDWAPLYLQVKNALSVLDACDYRRIDLVVIQFLWRFLAFSGYQPDLGSCSSCGAEVDYSEPLFLREEDSSFVCSRCAGSSFLITGGMRKYLSHTLGMDLGSSMSIGLDQKSLLSMKRILLLMVENLLEVRLNSLKF